MTQHITTIPTACIQLWYAQPPQNRFTFPTDGRIVTGKVPPLDSWAVMNQLIPVESRNDMVKGIVYGCGALPELDPRGNAMTVAEKWITNEGWNHEMDRYIRHNTAPSERYVLATPGSTHYRLPPAPREVDGLFLAGDWVKGDLNAGCLETAVSTAWQAANHCIQFLDKQ